MKFDSMLKLLSVNMIYCGEFTVIYLCFEVVIFRAISYSLFNK